MSKNIEELTVIELKAIATAVGTEASVDFEILLVDN